MGKRFYVLWGQSNMVGQGMVGNLPDGLDAAMSDVQVWDGSSFEALQADVNTGSVGAAPPWDFGQEITFGRTLADDFGETIYLLKVGCGHAH